MTVAGLAPIGVLERDRLARFFPTLFRLTMLFAAGEAFLAVVVPRSVIEAKINWQTAYRKHWIHYERFDG